MLFFGYSGNFNGLLIFRYSTEFVLVLGLQTSSKGTNNDSIIFDVIGTIPDISLHEKVLSV